MPESTKPLWDQGRLYWRHDETGGWQTSDTGSHLPSVVLPAPGDFRHPGKPIELYSMRGPHLASLNPGAARWLAARLLEAAAITEMQHQGAM